MQEVHLGHSAEVRRKSISYLKKELEIDYHEVEIATLYNRFGSHPSHVSFGIRCNLFNAYIFYTYDIVAKLTLMLRIIRVSMKIKFSKIGKSTVRMS